MKKSIALIITMALVVSLTGCFGVPSSMMPDKWIDTVEEATTDLDFTQFKSVKVTGKMGSIDVDASYSVNFEDGKPVYALSDTSMTDQDALSYLEEEVISYGLLTNDKAEDIIDYILTVNPDDSDTITYIFILDKFTLSKNYCPDNTGIDNLSFYTWDETDLSLSSFTYTAKTDDVVEETYDLTLTWEK